MLKRQRPASPSPFYDATEDEKSLPEDLFEPMSKRRRYFAPSKSNSLSREFSPPEDVSDEDERQTGPSHRPFRREGVQEWQQYAGEYKEENAKLHDLHAEQRHRILFSIQHSTGCLPSIANDYPVVAAQASESDNTRNTRAPNSPITAEKEAEVVSRRYEETNRLLGSLFLNRRRAGGDSIEPPS